MTLTAPNTPITACDSRTPRSRPAIAEQERALLAEAYALLAEYNCVLALTSRHVTRAKVKDWLDRAKETIK